MNSTDRLSPPAAATTTTETSRQWDTALLRDPHLVPDKRKRVQRMFSAIAPSYDLNNRLHSLWMDQHWRRTAVHLARLSKDDTVVDVACGTGDLTLLFHRALTRLDPNAKRPLGIDFTYAMLPIARKKALGAPSIPARRPEPPLPATNRAYFTTGDAQALPLPDACADVVSIAFGIRNVADPARALSEFRRILRPGGRLIILEFSLPKNPMLKTLYNFYFRQILPRSATLISGDKSGAYRYLPESVNTFIGPDQMVAMMRSAGFAAVEQHPMTFGVCICYRGLVNA